MNVLFITHYPSMYGANQSLLQLMLELREKYNIEPLVLMRSKGALCESLDQNNINYMVSHFYWWVNQESWLFARFHNLIKQFRNFFKVRKAFEKLKNKNIDLIYTNSVTINIGVLLSKKLNCPHIWHLRESLEQFSFKLSFGNSISKYYLRMGADKFILISKYLAGYYQDYLPFNKTNIVYNGIQLPLNYRLSNTYTQIINICIVGVVSEQKNQLEAIKSIDILVNKKNIKNIKLFIVGGKKEDYYQSMQKIISENNISEYVDYLGHQNEVNSILQNMNLGLMCSKNEAFGRVTIEYMLNRMPVIASNSGANQELIESGKNGQIYELGNAEDLADKILSFIENPELLEKYGAYAQKFAIDNFSSKKNSDAIYQIINDLIQKERITFQ